MCGEKKSWETRLRRGLKSIHRTDQLEQNWGKNKTITTRKEGWGIRCPLLGVKKRFFRQSEEKSRILFD